jgi:hypothetical protein
MNRNNLRKAALYGAKIASTDTSHIAVHSAMQRTLGFARPPSWEESDSFTPETEKLADPSRREFIEADPVNLSAARSILSLAALDHATHTINTDSRLTPAGRADKLAKPRVNTIKAIATAAADVKAHGATVHTRASAFYAPLKLPAGDTQAASEDRELRDHWKSSPLPKRTVLLGEMQTGQHERLLQALTRSPIQLEKHEASIIQSCWLDTVAKRDPKQHTEVQAALDTHGWADGVVKAAARYARKSVGLSQTEITQAAKDTGGEFMFADDNASITPTSAHVAA